MKILDAALDYAERGYYVFPCEPRGKRPLTTHGLNDATTDPDVLRGWWSRWPAANVAIATGAVSGIMVIDLDGPHALAAWDQLEAQHGRTQTLTATTGRGRHLYYRHPGGTISNSAGKLGPGIDVRGDGGYVIAPPSVHPNGTVYRWADDADALAAFPIPAPTERERMQYAPITGSGRTRYAAKALEGEIAKVATSPVGCRNDTLNRAAFNLGTLVGAHVLDAYDAIGHLLGAALHAGLSDSEARATIASGLEAGISQPRQVAQ